MQIFDETEFITFFRVGFDDPTVAELMELAEDCHAPPASVIAAIVKDVLALRKRGVDRDVAISLQ